jgi:hypothetical protein
LKDFIWWSGLPAADARQGLESARGKLAQEGIEGETYWVPPNRRLPPPSPSAAWLLPCFDEYIVGYKDREAILDPRHAARSGNGLLHPTIAVGGRIAGTWTRTIRRGGVLVSASLFSPLSRAEARGVSAAVARYGDFLRMPAVLS